MGEEQAQCYLSAIEGALAQLGAEGRGGKGEKPLVLIMSDDERAVEMLEEEHGGGAGEWEFVGVDRVVLGEDAGGGGGFNSSSFREVSSLSLFALCSRHIA